MKFRVSTRENVIFKSGMHWTRSRKKGQISMRTAKSLYSRVPEKVGSISCKTVTENLNKDDNDTNSLGSQ